LFNSQGCVCRIDALDGPCVSDWITRSERILSTYVTYYVVNNNLLTLQKVIDYQFARGKVFYLEEPFKLTRLSLEHGKSLDTQIKRLIEDLVNECVEVDDKDLIQFLISLKSDHNLEFTDPSQSEANSCSCIMQEIDSTCQHYDLKKTSVAEKENESDSEINIHERLIITQLRDRKKHGK
jgi:hypothetical protein